MATRLGSRLRNQPEAGRFRKIVEFDQSKGIGRLARSRRSRFGYWFGCPTTTGGAIVNKGYLILAGPLLINYSTHNELSTSHFDEINAFKYNRQLIPVVTIVSPSVCVLSTMLVVERTRLVNVIALKRHVSRLIIIVHVLQFVGVDLLSACTISSCWLSW